MTPQQLVQNVLLGSGVTASNITYTGCAKSIAEFSGLTNIGLGHGVIMTTGITTGVNGPQGPNNSSQTSTDNQYAGDSLLSSINGDITNDAAILEFDFIPTGDTIKFRYVFSSEEYPEFACGSLGINDIFGFFITGPNPSGGNYVKKNIALIPNTTLPVSIKTINNKGCTPYSKYYVDNTGGTSIQYDGFTTPLTAIAPVKCGSTYHIKLAIADVLDAIYDSGVFLEAESFSGNGISINSKAAFGGIDTLIYEGCGQSSVVLKRGKSSIIQTDTVSYTISGTAVNGTDYTLTSTNFSGNNIVFPVGVDSIKLDLNAIQDQVPEGAEYFTITINVVRCNITYQKSLTIYINDVPPLRVSAGNDTMLVCPNSSVTLRANATGGIGVGNYICNWSNGAVGKSISVSPLTTTTYIVNVKDTCGLDLATDSVTVYVNYIPFTLNVSSNVQICPNDSTTLTATPKYGLPGYKIQWQPGNDTANSIVVKPTATSVYTVTATDKCGIQSTRFITVAVAQTKASFTYSLEHNLEVDFINTSAEAINAFWTFGDSAFSTLYDPYYHIYADTGTYTVTLIVSNAIGCTDTVRHTFTVYPDLYFYFPNSFSPNNNGINDMFMGKGFGVAKYKMTIYDRWGSVIFVSEDAAVGWDGKTKSGKVQMDSYVCVFDLEDFFGHTYHKMGNIMMVR